MKPNAREAELPAMREAVFERVSTVAPSTPPSTASTPSQAVDAARRKRAARQARWRKRKAERKAVAGAA
jgi:hypothetical protein